jgi:DNA primase
VQSETTGLSHTAQEVLRSRFKYIFICFDNDAPGLLDGEDLAFKTGFRNVVLPYFDGGKDISDAYKIYGKEWLIKNIKPLFDI